MVTEKMKQQVLLETAADTHALLEFCLAKYDLPVSALMALILGSGTMAVAIGMSREDLLEGVGHAWDFAERRAPKESDHVH